MPTHYRGTPEEILALDAYIKFTRANNTLESRLFQQNVVEDLTPTQFGVLETLHHLGPLCQGELSCKLLKSTGNVTLVLDNLEKLGLVERQRSNEDRRRVFISLTPAGQEKINRIFPHVANAIRAEMGILTPTEQVQFAQLCGYLGKQTREK